MIEVVILGSGNVATQLAKAFYKAVKVNLVQVYSRSTPSKFILKKKIATTNSIDSLKIADIYIIAISDDAISSFSKQLKLQNKLVVHTSGSVSLNNLQSTSKKGVFYPLQSISKNKKISFKNIPICLETEKKEDFILLETLANTISKKVYRIDSEQRKSLHVAAVFVNNFSNHLYKIAFDICKEKKVNFDILKPLIKETAKKIEFLSPKEAQTGPAKRNDKETLKKHLELLNKNQQKIYTLLSNSIMADNKL